MKKILLFISILFSLHSIGQRVTDNNTLLTKSEVSGGVPLTFTAHTWNGVVIGSTYGGTGINNAGRTLTISTNSGTISFGAASKTLTVNNSLAFSGTDGSTLNIGAGGTLGSNAFSSTTFLAASNNLSDVGDATTARNNILPSKTGNTLKVLRVNAGETDYELATIGGSGTVTNTGGSLTNNSIILGAGGADVKVVTGITSDGTSVINLGVNATTIGKLKMFGNTSGDVTLQPTAAAGTSTVQTLPATTGTLVNRVTTANGVSATNSDGALTISLGAITPSSSTISGLMKANSLNFGFQSIATAAGTTTLTSSSVYHTLFTGSTTQNCDLPDATTLTVGHRFKISNNSTGLVTVRTNGGATFWTLGASTDIEMVVTDVGTSAGTWEKDYRVGNAATGKVNTFNNSITWTGTDGTTMTFPSSDGTIAVTNIAQTWTAGIKPSFDADATNADIRLIGNAGNPSSLSDGDMWYNSTTLEMMARINGGNTILSNRDNEVLAYQALGSSAAAETVGLRLIEANTSTALVDNTVRFCPVYLEKAKTLTGIKVYVRTQGNYTADNNNRIGLYSYSGGTLTLVASSTNSGTLWTSAANAFQTINFSSTYAAAPGIYYVGLLYNNSAQTTAPTLGGGIAMNNAAMAAMDFTNSAKLWGTLSGQNNLPSSQASSGITGATASYWVILY